MADVGGDVSLRRVGGFVNIDCDWVVVWVCNDGVCALQCDARHASQHCCHSSTALQSGQLYSCHECSLGPQPGNQVAASLLLVGLHMHDKLQRLQQNARLPGLHRLVSSITRTGPPHCGSSPWKRDPGAWQPSQQVPGVVWNCGGQKCFGMHC